MNTVKIYVRLPPDKNKAVRRVGFKMPADIPQEEIFELGGAIDGGQALFEIENPFRNNALLRLERNLVDLLRHYDYEPEFA